jgi:hypothetical protein
MIVAVTKAVPVSPEDVDALVESLVGIPKAVVPLDGLADTWGLPAVELTAIVNAGVAAGRVELWIDAPAGPSIILSTTEAGILGLELWATPGPAFSDAWLAGSLRWIPRGSAPAETLESFHELAKLTETDILDEHGRGGFDKIADPRPRDLDNARAACRCGVGCLCDAEAEKQTRCRRMLRSMGLAVWEPVHFLGLGHQWPVEPDADGACGVCHEQGLDEERFACGVCEVASTTCFPRCRRARGQRGSSCRTATTAWPAARVRRSRLRGRPVRSQRSRAAGD